MSGLSRLVEQGCKAFAPACVRACVRACVPSRRTALPEIVEPEAEDIALMMRCENEQRAMRRAVETAVGRRRSNRLPIERLLDKVDLASKQAGTQAGRHAGAQARRRAGKQAGRHVGRHAGTQAGRQARRREGNYAGRQARRRRSQQVLPCCCLLGSPHRLEQAHASRRQRCA